MKEIIIYGGLFNPFHQGHYKICDYFDRKKKNIDKVIIVISKYKYYLKSENIASKFKIQIIKHSIRKLKSVEISKYELNRKEITPTYITLRHYKKLYSKHKICFVMGDDNLVKLNTWENYEEIISLSKIYVFKRNEKNYIKQKNKYKDYDNIVFLNNKVVDISSTLIRNGKRISKLSNYSQKIINNNYLYYKTRLNIFNDKARVIHSINVGNLARSRAKKFNINKNKAFFAGIYHDYFKNINSDNLKKYENYIPKNSNKNIKNALHGYMAANYFEQKWNYKKKDVLNAIANHTIPSLKMSKFEKFIFCCDKLSKERKWKNIKLCRDLLKVDIDKCFMYTLFYNIIFLLAKNIFSEHIVNLSEVYLETSLQEKLNFRKFR